jgi:cytoskeletal protein CcmA (bactofilin family)
VQTHSENQAYNIAQSAAMVAINDIRSDPSGSPFNPDPDSTYSYPSSSDFEDWVEMHGEYNVTTTNQGDTLLTIQSTGRFERSTYVVNVGLVKTSGGSGFPWPAFDSAIHSDENTAITNGNVYGDVYSGGTFSIPGNAQIHGDVYVIPDETNAVTINSGGITGSLYSNTTKANGINYANWGASIDGNLLVGPGADPDIVAPKISQWHSGHVGGSQGSLSEPIPPVELEEPEFPDSPATPNLLSSISVSGGPSNDITLDLRPGNAYTPSLSVASNRTLTINVGNQDRTLRIGNFNMTQGHLNIISEGEGSLQLYIDDNFNIGGGSTMNNNSNPGDFERSPLGLLIAYAGSNEFVVSGNQTINANMFVKDADLDFTGSGKVNGNVISGGENVTIRGDGTNNSRVIYAPNAHVDMTGSGKINGSLVAKSFQGTGNFYVNYTTDFEETLPDLPGSAGGGSPSIAVTYWN